VVGISFYLEKEKGWRYVQIVVCFGASHMRGIRVLIFEV